MKKSVVIRVQGKQYQVQEGDELIVDHLDVEPKKQIKLDQVLLTKTDKNTRIGQPLVTDAQVVAEVLEHFQGPKIRLAVYKAKSRYRRVKGFRPLQTKLRIHKLVTP